MGVNTNKNDWNHISRQAGLNCWIGKLADGTITTIQTMPWNYKPWGCGSGIKGSCNNGWIQFEICEDSLTDKNYFEKVYNEACEITAYLCNIYNIDPKGTVDINGIKVPTILCHVDAYNLGLGSNSSDVLHWFSKFDKDMDSVRNDVADLMGNNTIPEEKENKEEKVEISDSTSSKIEIEFKIGDEVKLLSGATYASGKEIPSWVFRSKLYVRDIRGNNVVISTAKNGAVTGVVSPNDLTLFTATTPSISNSNFTPYLVRINTEALNVRAGAGTSYRVTTQVKKGNVFTIVREKNGWG